MDSKFQNVMRKILFVLLVLSYCLPIAAQVNIQTGSATFSIPVFAWKDDRSRLMNAVALQYNSAYGLRVDEVATNVGQGWGLLGGGVISRIQAGEPDDQKPIEGNYDDINKYPAGYLYNTVSASQGCPTGLSRYPIFSHPNQLYKQHNTITADREQDYFTFQVNGQGGTFILGKNNGDKGVMLGDSKMKIWFNRDETLAANENTRTTIATFYIQDENGLIYTFSQRGKTKILKVKSPPRSSSVTGNPTYVEKEEDEVPLSYNPYITTNWHLTQVRDPLTGREINFRYENRNIDNLDGIDIRCIFSDEGDHNTAIVTQKRSIAVMPVIAGIAYPDGHSVTFEYDLSHSRFDLQGDYRMKSINVTWNNRVLSSYQLNTAYFILSKIGMPANVDEAQRARLCLRSVTKIGVDLKEDEPPYVFDYYSGTGNNGDFVPPPFYHFRDIWGYYNAGKNNELTAAGSKIPAFFSTINQIHFGMAKGLCFINNDGSASANQPVELNTVNPGFARNGLLKTITSPLGGVTTYEYEQNRFERTALENNAFFEYGAGVHVSKVLQSNGGASFDGNNTNTTSYVYRNTDGSTSFWGGNALPYNRIMSAYYYQPAGKHFSFPNCEFEYTYPGILSSEAFHSIPNENIDFMSTYGMTIFNLAVDVIMAICGNPINLIIDVVIQIVQIIKNCSEDFDEYGISYIYFDRDVFAKNSLPYQFSRVEVIQGDPYNNLGRTVYEFTSTVDYPIWANYYTSAKTEWTDPVDPFSFKQQGASWVYGLPKKITVKDANNRKVKETDYLYDWNSPNIKRSAVSDMSCHCQVDYSTSMSTDWMDLANLQNINYATSPTTYNIFRPFPAIVTAYQLKLDLYQMYTGRVELQGMIERNYKQGDDSRYVETHNHFDYNPNNYQVSRVTTTQSNGDKLITEKYYSIDYNAGGVLQSLVYNNIINVPIGTFSAIQKNGSATTEYLNAAVNEFTIVGNGDIKVSKSHVSRTTAPVTGYTFNAGNPYSFPGLTEVGRFIYDGNGHLIGANDEGGRLVANIYGYDDKYVIGSIVNVDPLTDRYAYTSFESLPLNSWSLIGNANYTNTAVTGDKAFALSGNSLAATITQGNNYKLSFWATGTVTINGVGATLVTSGPIVNGFTYYEYDIAAVSPTITVLGSVNIDELRLYPKNARMRTVTYDPLIGKTAECDENNRITYYEYDSLGRVRFIKDEKGNIIKMYEYNFKK